jgi:hypothetical protein
VFLRGPCRDVISKGQSQLLGSSVRETVKIEPTLVKTKNLHCCQRTTCEDTAGWQRLSGCCDDLRIVEISGGTVIACNSESCV